MFFSICISSQKSLHSTAQSVYRLFHESVSSVTLWNAARWSVTLPADPQAHCQLIPGACEPRFENHKLSLGFGICWAWGAATY